MKRDFGPYKFKGQTYLTKAELLKAQSRDRQLEKWKAKQPKPNYTKFQEWLITFCEEKEIDLSEPMEAGDGTMLATGDVLSAIISAPENEQKEIQKMLVMIDFKNGDVMHFLRHLAKALSKKDKVTL
jgi:hypothetical protein